MTKETRPKFTVITNTEIETLENKRLNSEESKNTTPPNTGYHTNPMYEKLLEFQDKQKRKRFTVEDLLKW